MNIMLSKLIILFSINIFKIHGYCPVDKFLDESTVAVKRCEEQGFGTGTPGAITCIATSFNLLSSNQQGVIPSNLIDFLAKQNFSNADKLVSECSIHVEAFAKTSDFVWSGDFAWTQLEKALENFLGCIKEEISAYVPNGVTRTLIFIEKSTTPGQDVFLVGGKPDCQENCEIDIQMNSLPSTWAKYNAWSKGVSHLNWNGPEATQGTYNNWPALGIPAAWTSNDPANALFHSDNLFGDHYWLVDMNLDCDQTENGWFEFKTIFSLGGEGGEPVITQGACTGQVGGESAVVSESHLARCGFTNVFKYGKGDCIVDSLCEE